MRESDFKPVCVPFFKFMNAEEPNSDLNKIDWSTASVQEKIDGSLIKMWYDNGKWHISTNGTIDAYKAPLSSTLHYDSYGKLFESAVSDETGSFAIYEYHLDENWTYMFELVPDENRVVVDPKRYQHKVYLLGARDNNTLEEVDMYERNDLWARENMAMPRRFDLHSYEDVKKAAEALNPAGEPEDEGFVVCDKNFNRVKVKSFKYVEVHHMRNNGVITHERLMNIILAGEQNEFLTYCPDYKEDLNKVERAYCLTIAEIKTACSSVTAKQFESRKDLAVYVKTKPTWIQGFMFAYDKLDEFIAKIKPSKWVEFMKAGGYLN